MRITERLAFYLFAVTTAIAAGKEVPVTSTCTECERYLGDNAHLWDDEHVMFLMPDGRIVVLVGCEGYMLVDPSAVGLEREGWEPAEHWTPALPASPAVVPPHRLPAGAPHEPGA